MKKSRQKVLFSVGFIIWILFGVGCSSPDHNYVAIEFRIWDEHEELTAARVRLTDMSGNFVTPVGHLRNVDMTTSSDQEAEEQDVLLDQGRRFTYIDGKFSLEGDFDSLRVEIVKGFHYEIVDDTIFNFDSKQGVDIMLNKALPISDESWYTGDVHVHHISAETAILEIRAEDLNVCNLLISDFTLDHNRFTGAVEPVSNTEHLVIYAQEYRQNRLGHVNLLNLTENLIEPSKTQRSHHYPLTIDALDQAHAQDGHVSWAHFAAWPGLEGPLGIVLKKVDAVELLCTIDPFQEPIFASDVVPEVRLNSGLKLWYRLLNCGIKLPITAGTDKMGNFVTVGANRTYAKVEGEFSYQNWIAALNAGRTFVSNSPFLTFTVDGKLPGSALEQNPGGEVELVAEVWSQMPLDRLEIVANGELLAEVSFKKGEQHKKLILNYRPQESVWLAARAYQFSAGPTRRGMSFSERRNEGGGPTVLNNYYGTLRPEVTFAHTSPIYLEVADQPIRSKQDAEYFVKYLQNSIDWLENSGSFPSESAKKEVLEAFEQGKQQFNALANDH